MTVTFDSEVFQNHRRLSNFCDFCPKQYSRPLNLKLICEPELPITSCRLSFSTVTFIICKSCLLWCWQYWTPCSL